MTITSESDDLGAIRAMVAEAERLQSDADGFARLLTDDVALVNFGGRRVLGRDNVREAMRQALKTPFAAVYTRNEVLDVQFLRRDVAVVSGLKHIADEREPAAGDAQLAERASLTFVMVKEHGAWLIALSQTTPIAV
jgi:uncharacterized protein (TIGR02246 family)